MIPERQRILGARDVRGADVRYEGEVDGVGVRIFFREYCFLDDIGVLKNLCY